MPSPRLLLDTCAIIWMTEGASIAARAAEAIDNAFHASQPLLVSPISAWERSLLVSLGRITSPISPKVWFDRLLESSEVKLTPMTLDILSDSSFLPGPIHRDPADRIIIATAREHDLTIVTRDRAILAYGDLGHVRTLAC